MAFELLEDFPKKHPSFEVNTARMVHDAPQKVRTLFVEGKDDRDFYLKMMKNVSGWRIKYGPRKNGVLGWYGKYLLNPTRAKYAAFCVDMDFDFIRIMLQNGPADFERQAICDDCFFYQLFDVKEGSGFNDIESFLVNSEPYLKVMASFYSDERYIRDVRNGVVSVAMFMGVFRVANLLTLNLLGLADGSSLLCVRDGEKFSVEFMLIHNLVHFEDMSLEGVSKIYGEIRNSFGGEHADAFPMLYIVVRKVLRYLSRHPEHRLNFLRGHDLTELLAAKLFYDCGTECQYFNASRKEWVDGLLGEPDNLKKFSESLEGELRQNAPCIRDEILNYPLRSLLEN